MNILRRRNAGDEAVSRCKRKLISSGSASGVTSAVQGGGVTPLRLAAVDQPMRMKLLAYEFQKYGMLEGTVRNVGADSDVDAAVEPHRLSGEADVSVFRALIELGSQELAANGLQLPLGAGMQVSAEIMQGKRTVLDYLLSPVQRVASEAGVEQ